MSNATQQVRHLRAGSMEYHRVRVVTLDGRELQ